MRKEPSTEAKFAFIFGLAMLSAMLCWIPVEPVSAGGPSPAYQQEAAYDTEVASLTSAVNAKAPKASPTFTGQTTVANASATGNLQVAGKAILNGNIGLGTSTPLVHFVDKVGTNEVVMRVSVSTAASSATSLSSIFSVADDNLYGKLTVVDADNGGRGFCDYAINGPGNTVGEGDDPFARFGTTPSASNYNVYYISGTAYFQNNTAGTSRMIFIYSGYGD